jgi:hypothetical protein
LEIGVVPRSWKSDIAIGIDILIPVGGHGDAADRAEGFKLAEIVAIAC